MTVEQFPQFFQAVQVCLLGNGDLIWMPLIDLISSNPHLALLLMSFPDWSAIIFRLPSVVERPQPRWAQLDLSTNSHRPTSLVPPNGWALTPTTPFVLSGKYTLAVNSRWSRKFL
ncbi:MAG: hypothetical protein CMN54_12840 [SAR324 cluster bacterium]|uniref:Uncharacterized protein n=1 Tax=SAR324 cluster bacterium TaxID=2024889 RepID=A0A2D6YMC8_9DELT|nr:hypothetical protein [SAR324 cluster bacterium]